MILLTCEIWILCDSECLIHYLLDWVYAANSQNNKLWGLLQCTQQYVRDTPLDLWAIHSLFHLHLAFVQLRNVEIFYTEQDGKEMKLNTSERYFEVLICSFPRHYFLISTASNIHLSPSRCWAIFSCLKKDSIAWHSEHVLWSQR